jgi:exopolysaccharide biosynthesis polyprenyl glycosylphosphotransferase
MENFQRKFLLAAFKLFDVFVMIAMFVFAAVVVYLQDNTVTLHITLQEFLQLRFKIENYALFSVFVLIWHLIFSGFGLYNSYRLSSLKAEIIDLLIAITLYLLILVISAWIFKIEIITLTFILVFFGCTSTFTISSRLVLRHMLKLVRLHNRNLRHILVVGTNERARKFLQKIESRPELGYHFVGFVDEQWKGNRDLENYGWQLVSNLNDFNAYIRENVVDEVVIALPIKSLYQEASQIFTACEEQGITVRNLSDIFTAKLAHSKTENIEDESLISHYTGAMWGWQVVVKRVFDIVISTFLLIFLSPLAFVTAIAIKIDSPGPIHFVQERVGLNKRRFQLYKFRTMVAGADKEQEDLDALNEASGPVFKIKEDPRITSIGKILRKTSIDELPQLLNVIKGDMSLVGPRPLPIRDYNGFDQDWHRRRFSVRPGITCLWQVDGRSSIPFEKWMELDIHYIDRWSLWLDCKILLKTVYAVIYGSGAA